MTVGRVLHRLGDEASARKAAQRGLELAQACEGGDPPACSLARSIPR